MRCIFPFVLRDLQKKMVFVGGPRQVGKATFARSLLERCYPGGISLNWDFDPDRQAILERKWTEEMPLLVFGELHKYPRWKSWLKGNCDVSGNRSSFLVTGSARLDAYRRGWRLPAGTLPLLAPPPVHPGRTAVGIIPGEALTRLLTVGGFPEPFLVNDGREARRWRRERFDRVVREDIRDIQTLGLFLDLLRRRVGGMAALSNLAAELHVTGRAPSAE